MGKRRDRKYAQEIWAQMEDRYNPAFLLELFEALETASSPTEKWDRLVEISEKWGYPPQEVASDSMPASWLARSEEGKGVES